MIFSDLIIAADNQSVMRVYHQGSTYVHPDVVGDLLIVNHDHSYIGYVCTMPRSCASGST